MEFATALLRVRLPASRRTGRMRLLHRPRVRLLRLHLRPCFLPLHLQGLPEGRRHRAVIDGVFALLYPGKPA